MTISSLTKGTTYTFNVRAVNSVGAGPVATVDKTPSGKPGPVQNLTATPGHGEITLSWNEPSDNGGSAIVYYEVEKYNSSTSTWDHEFSPTMPTHTDENAAVGVTQDYRVSAVNANRGAPSDWATVSGLAQGHQVPGAPQKLEANSGNGYIIYTWEAPESDGGARITKYQYRSFGTPSPPTADPLDTVLWMDASGLSQRISNLTAANNYNFDVRAVNDVGPGSVESVDSQPASTVPALPRGLSATKLGSDSILLSWSPVPPPDNGGSIITQYQLQFKPGADGEWGDGATDSNEMADDYIIVTGASFTHGDAEEFQRQPSS